MGLIKINELIAMTKLSRPTIYRLIKAGSSFTTPNIAKDGSMGKIRSRRLDSQIGNGAKNHN